MEDTSSLITPQQRAMAFLIARLTPRERQIAMLLATGVSPTEVGDRLTMSPKRAAWSVRRTTTKLGAQTPQQIAALLATYGMDLLPWNSAPAAQ